MASEQDIVFRLLAFKWDATSPHEAADEITRLRTRIAELERQQDAAGDYRYLADHVERVLLRCSAAGAEGIPDTHHDCGMTVMEANDLLAVMLQFSSRITELEARAKRADVLEQAVEVLLGTLLDTIYAECGLESDGDGAKIDTKCMSDHEAACMVLEAAHIAESSDGRIYTVKRWPSTGDACLILSDAIAAAEREAE